MHARRYEECGASFHSALSSLRFDLFARRGGRGAMFWMASARLAPLAPSHWPWGWSIVLRCAALLFITKIWRRGAARGRRPQSALTPRKQLSECSAGNGSPLYLPGARTRRTLARLARSLQKMPHSLAFAVILASTGRPTPLHADSTCKFFNEGTRVVFFYSIVGSITI